MEDWSMQTWFGVAAFALFVFAVGVVARIRALSKQSAEIHKTLDYSKMKKWEDDDDWGESASDASEKTPADRFDR